MTLADKLRFLVDRLEDGKPFLINDVEHVSDKNELKMGDVISVDINKLNPADLKLKPTWEFTEDEKVILRNLDDKWKWIARDESGGLCLYSQKTNKLDNVWKFFSDEFMSFDCFDHLFQSVQWEDDEPCEFRKYL